jgi:aryl carrier-like protein
VTLRDDLRAEVCRLIFGQPVPESELPDDADLFEAGLDSLAILKLVAWIECRRGAPFSEAAPASAHFRTIRSLVAFAQS